MLALLIALIAFAALTRKLIARMQVSRQRPIAFPHSPKTWITIACVAALSLISTGIIQSDGAPWRHKDYPRYAMLYREAHHGWSFPQTCSGLSRGLFRLCELGSSDNRTLVIGDSHAEQLYPRFIDYAAAGHAAAFLTMRRCPPIPGLEVIGDSRCAGFAQSAFDLAGRGHYQRIIISAMWNEYIGAAGAVPVCFVTANGCAANDKSEQADERMKAVLAGYAVMLKRFTDSGTLVIILGPVPGNKVDLPIELLRLDILGRDRTDLLAGIARSSHDKESALTLKRLAQVAEASGSLLVDPACWLCDAERCPTMDAGGHPEFIDSNHYTSRAVTGQRFRFVDDIMKIQAD